MTRQTFPRVGQLLSIFGTSLLIVFATLTALDALFRKFFNLSLGALYEVGELTLVVSVFLGFPLAAWSNQHIQIDFLFQRLSQSQKTFLSRVVSLLNALVMTLIAWQLFELTQNFLESHRTTLTTNIALWPVAALCGACSILTALSFLTRSPKETSGDQT